MNRFHLGVDIVSVKRIEDSYASYQEKFLAKFLTENEINSLKITPQRLASRWAAKEALFKAFSSAGLTTTYRDFEIITSDTGCPRVKHLFKDWHAEISLSHENDYAIAYCQIKKIQS
ncbi:MAG: holo-ACP synthase [Bdellovibrionales bacterium]|nr:holo-ACP synthase [Bdellovibrionales bacterium]